MRTIRQVRTVLAPALALVGALTLASCGHDDAAQATSAAHADVASTSHDTGDPATWPLTGLPVPAGQSAAQTRPVLVLKMDNTSSSAPQVGLGSADLVVEELVEGGITRLAAMFYSHIPGTVGPVRSMRASDIGIVSPEHATLVTSGAAPITIKRLHDAGVHYVADNATAFSRDPSRIAPYNLMTKLSTVAASQHQHASRPPDYLPWGPEPSGKPGIPARTLGATFPGGRTTQWSYTHGHYVNQNSFAAPGDGFDADTVLVLRVQITDAGYKDPAGAFVPETVLTGGGDAMLFHGGRLVRGSWHKDSLGSPLQLSVGGHPLTVPAGHTWIELVPAVGGSVSFRP